MMYKEPENFVPEFIERTLDVVKIYKGECEVTLFINAMVGLFIIPRENCYDILCDNMIESTLLSSIQKKCTDKSPELKGNNKLKYISRRIRNAVAHGHLVFEAEKDPYGNVGKDIKRICFYDDTNAKVKQHNYKNYEFSAKIEMDLLRRFVIGFAEAVKQNCGGNSNVKIRY